MRTGEVTRIPPRVTWSGSGMVVWRTIARIPFGRPEPCGTTHIGRISRIAPGGNVSTPYTHAAKRRHPQFARVRHREIHEHSVEESPHLVGADELSQLMSREAEVRGACGTERQTVVDWHALSIEEVDSRAGGPPSNCG